MIVVSYFISRILLHTSSMCSFWYKKLDNILDFSYFFLNFLYWHTSHWSIKEADCRAQLKPTITYLFFLRWIKIWNIQYLTMQRNVLTVLLLSIRLVQLQQIYRYIYIYIFMLCTLQVIYTKAMFRIKKKEENI